MKIKAIFVGILCLIGVLSCNVYAAICGEVLSTDITAYIDEQPIESFNINDYTYVIAEDLRGYGFDVDWSEAERTLKIRRNREADRVFMSMEKVNIKKSEVPFRKHVFDVYETDIVTYIDNQEANAYNVDGQTLIMIDELSRFGFFDYNDAERCVKIDMAGFDEQAKSNPAEGGGEVLLPCSKIEGSIIFSGVVHNGKPDGYGKISEHYEFTNGLESTEDYYTSGNFAGNKMNGYIYSYGTKTPHNGSDRRIREYYSLVYYTDGVFGGRYDYYNNTAAMTGYYLEISKAGGEVASRVEKNGTFRRDITIDAEYRYGYRIDKEGHVDRFGQVIDYSPVDGGKIVSVSADSDAAYIINEAGDLFVFGEIGTGDYYNKKEVPIKLDTGLKSVADDTFGVNVTAIDNSGNMYYLWDKIYKYNNVDVPVVYREVKKSTEWFFLTNDGRLYRKPIDFEWTMYDEPVLVAENVKDFTSSALSLMYQTNDGTVYGARLKYAEDSGSAYLDDYDLSTPYKLFDDAKHISLVGRYLVVDNNNVLWGWSSPYYGTGYKDPNGIFTTHEPIKLAEGVTAAKAGSMFIAYTKTDGSLYVAPDKTEPENKMLFDITGEEKILDNVVDFAVGRRFLLAVKSDGTLWTWGGYENVDLYTPLGVSGVTSAREPMRIKDFYKMN